MPAQADAPERGRGEVAADGEADAARRDDDAETDVSRVERVDGEEDFRDVDGRAREDHDVPDDEHGPQRSARHHEAEAVRDVAPVPAGERLLGAELPLGDRRDETDGHEERQRVHGIRRVRAPRA